MYKLIAVDLDGTLLNSYGAVTENTKNAIKKVEEHIKKRTSCILGKFEYR